MDDLERTRAREWLRERRGDISQAALADDINTVLPDWTITRDRYSKYESGAVPFGKTVLERFVAYWTAKGYPGGPDFSPPPPVVSLEERAVRAQERQADAAEEQARLAKLEVAALDRLVALLALGQVDAADQEAVDETAAAFAVVAPALASALRRRRSGPAALSVGQ